MEKYILVVDEGTTGVRSIIFDKENTVISEAYESIPQIYPKPGWVEQDPEIIWEKTLAVMKASLKKKKISAEQILALGIATQRSTNLLWDKSTGKPIYNAITWQDTRTSELCKQMDAKMNMRFIRGLGSVVRILSHIITPLRASRSGKRLITASMLSFTPASSLAHVRWILDNVQGARQKAERSDLLEGTIDTWLVWKLTGGKVHATDFSNVSATGMFDTFTLQWSDLFLNTFEIPKNLLPELKESSDDYGVVDEKIFGAEIPIAGVIADQQSALFAETCFAVGDVKCTNGTGSFIDMNVGSEPAASEHNLLPFIAWKLNGEVTYMLEGFVSSTGAAVQWLCDGICMIGEPAETETLARSVDDTGGVFLVPAFTGLTAPYWDASARGVIIGLTRGTTKAHVARATLESITYQCNDILRAMEKDSNITISSIKTDGGASKNNFLLQFMSDILNVGVERPKMLDATALGAAYLAGLKVGYWLSKEDLKKHRHVDVTFSPKMDATKREALLVNWKKAVQRSMKWAD